MNAYLDLRRVQDRPGELRAEAANYRLGRAGVFSFRHRLARLLQAWAERIDDMQRPSNGGRGLDEPPRPAPNFS